MKNIRSIWDRAVDDYLNLPAVRWLEKKNVQEKSYAEMDRCVRAVRATLEAESFRGAHIALIGTSSPEWIEAYLGIVTGINIAVPLDAGLPDDELIELLQRSDSEALFLSPGKAGLRDRALFECPKLRRVWMLSADEFKGFLSNAFGSRANNGLGVAVKPGTVDSQTSEELDTASRHELVNAQDFRTLDTSPITGVVDVQGAESFEVATIIYTSGTTGKSKGVMLTQENLAENVSSVEYDAAPGCVVMSVLPIHHAYCLVMDYLKTLSLGAVICINDSFMHMVRNMSIFKPEVMLMVPLMVETIYKKLSAAEEDALHNSSIGETMSKSGLSEELVSMVRKNIAEKVFGGKLRIIFTGGAHLDPFYIEKFAEYGINILEGYGMSECSPVITSNTPDNHKPGSIGKPLKNVQIKFEDGEILVRGSSVMKGYYKMPEETADAIKDGWLHTGDKGYLDEDGYLFINGRVKNLIIMSNGENVSPEEIENKLSLSPLIAEVIVTGENNGLTARIFPDADYADKNGIKGETLRVELQRFIDDYNRTQPTYRHITSIVVRSTPFIRNSTGKIRRQDALRENPAA